MLPLVSIIIPCFNAGRWLSEAINSCLHQTYQNIEIIVIDDGSNDNSLEIIKNFSHQIIWKSIPRSGGNFARNLGFSLSQGEYIQFLDADDYISPEKIARQVDFLEKKSVDIVYGDWRHKYHLPDGTSFLGDIKISGTQTDILESLLGTWWVALAAFLYRRSLIINSQGWDEKLFAAQDRDFLISLVINGAKVDYQPGCYSIYRRYGNITVSTRSKEFWISSHLLVLNKSEQQLIKLNRLSTNYHQAIALSYFYLAREVLLIDYSAYLELLEQALLHFPKFKNKNKSLIYQILQNYLGFRQTERIACYVLLLNKLYHLIRNQSLWHPKKFPFIPV
ncbi:glycosyltransferase family 2 protein [Calothrix sp. PCC 6303]|uniref:glycosyltransferase family 2 protein n=1 Tax=Calothrix sp. PCC 6303 TaxID=1170562 RepID=UPI0002A0343A|nr:glycosyltransferase [Calothrix sp. PCC 6303]AFZ04326.1 glycosyl transferase family 2 [Calothrix sp. PCC 6303]